VIAGAAKKSPLSIIKAKTIVWVSDEDDNDPFEAEKIWTAKCVGPVAAKDLTKEEKGFWYWLSFVKCTSNYKYPRKNVILTEQAARLFAYEV
jgi:hypothetical protein